jgi:pyruvate formate lyase activating enzyme
MDLHPDGAHPDGAIAATLRDDMHEARFWHADESGGDKVVCTLCPRLCRIGDGQAGFCFIRQNVGGRLYNLGYGRSTGFCIDPIEKKPLNHFLPGTPILSFGTAGCNLGCKFCQNWDISRARLTERELAEASPDDVAQAALRHGCPSIAYTYNDPVIFAEYVIDISRAARARGVKNVLVTAGYVTAEARPELYALADAANVDLKGFTEDFYQKVTLSHLAPVLETLIYIRRETRCWLEITNLMIPGLNDSPAETRALAEWIGKELGDDVPVHFTAFHPDYKLTDRPRTPTRTLVAARAIAREVGLRHVYVGNVHDDEGQTTFCAHCGVPLIERDGFALLAYRLDDNGACSDCKTRLPGFFAAGGARPTPGRRRSLGLRLA